MKYNFKEAQLKDTFLEDFFKIFKQKIFPTGVVTVVGMPGVGLSFFARFLATRNYADFIYVDVASLSMPTKHNFFVSLLNELGIKKAPSDQQEILDLCKIKILEVLKSKKRIVFIFNRFDDLGKQIDSNLLNNIRTLRHIAADKISIVIIAHKPIYKIVPIAVTGPNLDIFSNIIYFPPFSKKDLENLIKLNSPDLYKTIKKIKNIYNLSGGHYQIFKLILKSEGNYTQDLFITLAFKNIYEGLSYNQKKEIQKIVFKNKIADLDPELLSIGIIKNEVSRVSLFTDLFRDYVRNRARLKLPFKEQKLFNILKKREGQLVYKDLIFKNLWNEAEQQAATDWALNSLVYRLRKNPYFIARGYAIESHKKMGYSLVRI